MEMYCGIRKNYIFERDTKDEHRLITFNRYQFASIIIH